MILEKLVIENFRQFKGRQEIVFSDNREKNVTLIHAENGFGKTTLLNAILWALYGHNGLTPDFEGQDKLIHNGLAHEYRTRTSELEMKVQLTFMHENHRHIVTRTLSLAQQDVDARRTELDLEIKRDGQTFRDDNPKRLIQSIVPEGIAKFLFFNGERMDHLGLDENRTKVTEAIHQMLGLNLLKTTIDDLRHNSVRGRLRKELSDNTSDEKRELLDQLDQLDEKLVKEGKSLEIANTEINVLADEIKLIENKLAANKESHDLQRRRGKLKQQEEEVNLGLDDISKRLAKLVAEDGYSLFTVNLVQRGKQIMKDLRAQNMIPAPVIDSFLEELLENGRCICERCLEPGTAEYDAVKQQLSLAPNQDFNNAVSALDHAVGILESLAETTETQMTQLNAERVELQSTSRALAEEIAEIHQKIGGKNDDTVTELEDARHQKDLKRDEVLSQRGKLEGRIETTKAEIENLNGVISQVEEQEGKAALAQRRLTAADECASTLEEILKAETEELRPMLNDEIKEHFGKIIDRDYWAELTDDFELRIRHRIGTGEDQKEEDVALSSGQRQVKLLVFIASLLSLAKKRAEIPTIVAGLSGSEYPLVTDSPFGQLSAFREGISRWVPNLAPQVIILVTPEQYDGNVENALAETGRVGKRYYLGYHAPQSSLRDGAATKITIHGNSYQQYFEADEEHTKIIPVEL